MEEDLVGFLNVHGGRNRHDQGDVGQGRRGAAIAAEQRNAVQTLRPGHRQRSQDIRRVPARGENHQDVAFLAEACHLPREHFLKGVVVRRGREEGRVARQIQRGEGPAVFVESAEQFRGEVPAFRRAAAIAATQNLAARGEGLRHQGRGGSNRFLQPAQASDGLEAVVDELLKRAGCHGRE